jgi:hypothetical protein
VAFLCRREAAARRLIEQERIMKMEQPKVGEEIRKMAYEPLLPVEKRLIAWSFGLGVVLLVILVAVSRAFLH